MKWCSQNFYDWHPVPYAWIPACFDNVTYWLEYPPYERKAKFETAEAGCYYEYRRK